ncbi:unnamed protein product, partial [Rangifer tarandus platyrhynchus]
MSVITFDEISGSQTLCVDGPPVRRGFRLLSDAAAARGCWSPMDQEVSSGDPCRGSVTVTPGSHTAVAAKGPEYFTKCLLETNRGAALLGIQRPVLRFLGQSCSDITTQQFPLLLRKCWGNLRRQR